MATQEEILEFLEKKGFADLKELKEHFGIRHKGSSYLPQRLKALEKKGLIAKISIGRITVYVCTEIKVHKEDLKKYSKRKRKQIIREENILKILRIVRERKLINWRQLKDNLNWNTKTLNKYINYLIKQGIIFEKRVGKLRLFTTSLF